MLIFLGFGFMNCSARCPRATSRLALSTRPSRSPLVAQVAGKVART